MATFKTRARALDMLGRQQIAGIPTAISELFKNAHDAYADRVEVDYYRTDRLFILRDDGLGMTKDEFLSRWLTLGTESKLLVKGADLPPVDHSKAKRTLLGEKGVGRLAIAIIGPQVLVLSRAIREDDLCETVAAFINWGLFECPGADLDQIEIPVRTFSNGSLPTSEDLAEMVGVCRRTLERLKGKFEDDKYAQISSELDAFDLDPSEIDGYLPEMSLADDGHGTHFIISPASEVLNSDIDDGWETDGAPNLFKMLRGFSNTMTPDHSRPVIQTAFRDHKNDDAYEDLISETTFFTPDEFKNADHQISGYFDEYGQFRGYVSIYGKDFSDHIISWKGGHGFPTKCGPFKISVANVQGQSRESTLPLEDWGQLIQKMNRFGGLYIYRDGVRLLPYGNTDFDWLDLERNRTKSASYYHFSFRRIFGVVEITSSVNKYLTEKAGREGFRENKAYRDLKSILKNFFIQLAADFFRAEANNEYYQQKRTELKHLDAARKRREELVSEKKARFIRELNTFFARYDKDEPQQLVTELIGRIQSDLTVAGNKEDSAEVAEAFLAVESNARFQLKELEGRYRVTKPRGVALSKDVTRDWESYQRIFVELQRSVFARARELVEGEVQEQAAQARVALDRRLRIERSLEELSADLKDMAKEERKATEERAELVNNEICFAAKTSVAKVNRVMSEVFADFARLNVTEMDDDSVLRERNNLETALIEVRDSEQNYLRSLQAQLEGIDTSGAPSQIEQMEALEQRTIALEEQAHADLQLTQLGMAIEVINHEFDSSVRSIRDHIRRLRGWADMNEGLENVYQGIRSSFEHLDGYLTLFTPFHRRLYRKKIEISGSAITKFLNDLFGERFKRHSVSLNSSSSFNKIKFLGYPSSFYPVFVNVVDNSIFWLKDQPQREILLDVMGGALVIKDTGPGIPERDHEAVFELGFSRKPGGRGMGLHISREVLSRENYELILMPTDTGTEFHISPAQEETEG
ncbi:ATP-binding protein [Maridesulfovibrio sp.]|uniref:ATP-binding protein n=1 Tax=Maridesulfovibrio sp. TaxID=2795000 RepID=UPI0039F05DC1